MGKVSLIGIWKRRTGFVLGERGFCVREYNGRAYTYCFHRLSNTSTPAQQQSQKQMADVSAQAKLIWADPLQKQMWLRLFSDYQQLRRSCPFLTSEMLLVRLGLIRPVVQAECTRLVVDNQGVHMEHYRTRRRQKNPFYKTAWMMLVGTTSIQFQQHTAPQLQQHSTIPSSLPSLQGRAGERLERLPKPFFIGTSSEVCRESIGSNVYSSYTRSVPQYGLSASFSSRFASPFAFRKSISSPRRTFSSRFYSTSCSPPSRSTASSFPRIQAPYLLTRRPMRSPAPPMALSFFL